MKQILVASDFSNSASHAMTYALSLAKILQMEVAVIHAIHPTEGINNSTYNAIFIEDYYAKKRSALKEWAETFRQNEAYQEVPIKTVCDVGFLRKVINKYTEYNAVSFLMMGITGATGIKGIVGSNTSMVVTKMRIPTLIVPLESVLPAFPAVALATDYKTTKLSVKDVKALTQILKATNPKKLDVLHIAEKDMDAKSIKNGEKKLKEQIPNVEINFNYIDDEGKTSNGIIDFIETNETDILCLVKRNHNIIYRLFASSTVNEVLNKSVKAILVLHE
ncbi:universal stress protein [Chryseobacterium polytrichastri]|uniref:Nucleotide-binding universal stress protein, UspA family n=1 Tax=Chryseobacterium polytrichastri TaxID=1302687 RepID=A0A1M6Q948_9FLAO|nr:universal stress protein [Chryseobacterium polytrichastri]SHK16617.1 Nucleotide-binding universal stress protein, UspA family [Chryseobacterium polytrichastri]